MPKKSDTTRRKLPIQRTDRAAASFVGRADLSRYDLSAMRPVRFEFAPKSARLNMRLPENLLAAVKDAAADTGVPLPALHPPAARARARRPEVASRPDDRLSAAARLQPPRHPEIPPAGCVNE